MCHGPLHSSDDFIDIRFYRGDVNLEISFMTERLQIVFFEELLSQIGKRTAAVDQISSLLSIGKDAVYRRLRGDSELTLDELKILAQHYNISLDQLLFQDSDKALFTVASFSTPVNAFDDYLENMIRYLDLGLSLPDAEIIYATAEIPVFYYCLFPEIMCFKLYVWAKTVWNIEAFSKKKFSFDLFSPYTMKLIQQWNDRYLQIKTTELWCLNIFDNSLNQIEYVFSNSDFEKSSDALVICDAMSNLAHHVCQMAEKGKKFKPDEHGVSSTVPFKLYHNELVYTNNTIFLKSNTVNAVFSTFDSPNVLMTTDPKVFRHTEKWFQGIKSKSDYITEVSEKNRNIFFNKLEKKVSRTKNKISSMMEDVL